MLPITILFGLTAPLSLVIAAITYHERRIGIALMSACIEREALLFVEDNGDVRFDNKRCINLITN